ncbi:MAG: DUF2339 domain-containing protein [Deltaproteobacteria bacterium]|nr:DUF2339 domain-containing protein [Deltaproteobacteria bacterium]
MSDEKRLSDLEGVVGFLYQKVREHEEALARAGLAAAPPPPAPAAQQPAPDAATGAPSSGAAAVDETVPTAAVALGAPPLGGQAPSPPAAAPAARPPAERWESFLATGLLGRIGMIALLFGVAFFLKLAFDSNLIGPSGRVAIGLLGGALLLALGAYYERKGGASSGLGTRIFARTLTGGGLGVLYLSLFAAFAWYELFGQLQAGALMALVTATGVVLALRYDALAIAMMTFAGGYLTPVLLSTGQDRPIELFAYVLVLDLGAFAVAFFRKWRPLDALAFVATEALLLGWLSEFYDFYADPRVWLAVGLLALFFALFTLLPLVNAVVSRRKAALYELFFVFVNTVFFYATAYAVLDSHHVRSTGALSHQALLGPFTVAVAGYLGILGWLIHRRLRDADPRLAACLYALALGLTTLAIPVQLEAHPVAIGWAVEGLVLLWLGLRARSRPIEIGGDLVLLLGFFCAPLVEAQNERADQWLVLLNPAFLGHATVALSLLGGAFLYRKRVAERLDRAIQMGLACLFHLSALTGLSLELLFAVDRLGVGHGHADDAKGFALSGLWALWAAGTLAVGFLRRDVLQRIIAFTLFFITAAKVFLVDLAELAAIYRVLSFLVVGSLLVAASYLYSRWSARIEGDKS